MSDTRIAALGRYANETPTVRHGWYVSTLLFLVGAFNLMDRQILAILLEPIKRDLNVSDAAMGLLTGFAFVAFYTLTSLPIARLADAHSRRHIIALALVGWSALTSTSALATSYMQLALLRVGVGTAESATGPAGQSLLADFFPAARRTAPMAMLAIAPPVGVMLAFIIGGVLNQHLGWRMTLACMGAPGVLLALVWWITVREPVRGASDTAVAARAQHPLSTTVRYLLGLKSFCWMTLGASLTTFTVMGLVVWSPAYLERVHGVSTAQAGLSLGLATGLGGVAGGLCAGILAQRLASRDISWLLRLPALTSLLAAPLVGCFLLLGDSPVAIAMFFGIVFCSVAMLAPVMSATQSLARIHMRAVAAALVTLTFNFIGTGFGPFAVGALSDLLAPVLRTGSLRAGLWLTAAASIGAALAFAVGARHLPTDVTRSNEPG
ncbi:MAG TPA: MFS transporter [Steroidobacteraceae bacterium]|nr:MFS transporter [Steroidobacteraceae bacterium]